MKIIIFGLAAAGLITSGISFAQTTQRTAPAGAASTMPAPAQMTGGDQAVAATTNANALMPAKGANSFTKGEARHRIEKNGFANVDDLAKDHDGIWRGRAQKDGNTASVWLDYKGNVGSTN